MPSYWFLGSIYTMFFLSGVAALIYQVVWVRSLTLVFGGSHLAVTAVLSIFMGGLALGGYAIGRYVDRACRPLRLYGLLELGIAAFALVFTLLMNVYPAVYAWLARGRDGSVLYLTAIRVLFSILALIGPTTLMGGTLPVLSRFVSRSAETLRTSLSLLYGLNTLGAVLGAFLAGFVLLRVLSVSATIYIAVALNAVIGLASLWLQEKAAAVLDRREPNREGEERRARVSSAWWQEQPSGMLPFRLVLWGIGVSGFCALGYEVLWTRILTIAIGASVYGFTIMLIAFLTGIALGSKAYGLLLRIFRVKMPGVRRPIAWFGVVQIVIGMTALLVTIYIRDIPANSIRLQNVFLQAGLGSFGVRVWAGFALAFLYMVVPAFFMGVAFPLAGEVQARYRAAIGRAVGEVLASNTIGAILGAGVSGFVLIFLFGIERSLQMLTVTNIAMGVLVLAALARSRWAGAAVIAASLTILSLLAVNQSAMRFWDMKYFAIFRSNQPEAFRTPEMIAEAVENTDVLYYAEGVESIVSSIKIKGGEQSFLTNGRVEASSHLQAQQVQYTLGHLPMLLNRQPRKVLVVGTGSGMTLGATSVHPSVERITLAEIEPKVIGVARTFQDYNHRVLDNPKLRIVFNDGRNFLLTATEKFDVITADPIHPWFRGAGYLYTSEYFKLAAEHLEPGGVICQWLPIYELTPDDLRSVVRTFREQFKYTLMWLTHYDAELVGSNSPIVIDEAVLERRIAVPAVAGDLQRVMMGSATDFLSYFVMGTQGMKEFSREGILNTDDNLYLEFSAPFSIAAPSVMEANVKAIAAHRESLLPYLVPAQGEKALEEQRQIWERQLTAGRVADPALALFLGGKSGSQEFQGALSRLNQEFPWYAPGRFLNSEYQAVLAMEPRPLASLSLALTGENGARVVVELSAVLVPVSKSRASVMFVENRARVVYGQRYIEGPEHADAASRLTADVMATIRSAYQKEVETARSRGQNLPARKDTLPRIKALIRARLQPPHGK